MTEAKTTPSRTARSRSTAAKTSAASAAKETPEADRTDVPDVLVISKRKKKKRKSSKELRDADRAYRGVSRALERGADAVAAGLREHRKLSNKSARKRRDGALRDALDNWAQAVSTTIERSADIPVDLSRTVDSKRVWRNVRPFARLVRWP